MENPQAAAIKKLINELRSYTHRRYERFSTWGVDRENVWNAYGHNLNSLRHTVELPGELVCRSMIAQRFMDQAYFECTGSLDSGSEAATRERERIVEMAQKGAAKRNAEDKPASRIAAGTINYIEYCATVEEVLIGFQSFWGLCFVSSWTLVETVTTDLWIASLNEFPSLAVSVMSSGPAKSRKAEESSIPLWRIREHGFDLRSSMGEILKSRFNFNRLDEIRKAYRRAFGEGSEIDKALNSKELDFLEATRNLIVHRSGLVDQKYLDRTKNIPRFTSAPLNTRLPIDADVMCRAVHTAITTCHQLFAFVDQWASRIDQKLTSQLTELSNWKLLDENPQ